MILLSRYWKQTKRYWKYFLLLHLCFHGLIVLQWLCMVNTVRNLLSIWNYRRKYGRFLENYFWMKNVLGFFFFFSSRQNESIQTDTSKCNSLRTYSDTWKVPGLSLFLALLILVPKQGIRDVFLHIFLYCFPLCWICFQAGSTKGQPDGHRKF